MNHYGENQENVKKKKGGGGVRQGDQLCLNSLICVIYRYFPYPNSVFPLIIKVFPFSKGKNFMYFV